MNQRVVLGVLLGFILSLGLSVTTLHANDGDAGNIEIIKMSAFLQVDKCEVGNFPPDGRNGQVNCGYWRILPLLPTVEIELVKQDVPVDAGYEFWEGFWSEEATEEGVLFHANINIQKYRNCYVSRDGGTECYDSYTVKPSVGPVLSSRPTVETLSVSVSKIDDLNSMELKGESVEWNKYELTPVLSFGPKMADGIIDPGDPITDPDNE